MDTNVKTEAAGLLAKVFSWLVAILPPMLAANVMHWSGSVLTGHILSRKERIAVLAGSFGLSCAVHYVCESLHWAPGKEWIAIWSASICTEHLLKLFILHAGDIIKDWLRNNLQAALRFLKKK